jgi:hypothetical protein
MGVRVLAWIMVSQFAAIPVYAAAHNHDLTSTAGSLAVLAVIYTAGLRFVL